MLSGMSDPTHHDVIHATHESVHIDDMVVMEPSVSSRHQMRGRPANPAPAVGAAALRYWAGPGSRQMAETATVRPRKEPRPDFKIPLNVQVVWFRGSLQLGLPSRSSTNTFYSYLATLGHTRLFTFPLKTPKFFINWYTI